MKILHIIPSYKPAYVYGGPTVVVAQLAEALVKYGHQITIYTTTANGSTELDVTPNESKEVDGVKVFYFSRFTKDHTQASPALWKKLNRTINEFDVVHIHTWWNFLAIGAGWICYKHSIRPILSPHGMLSNYIINTNNLLVKRLIHKTIGKRLLKNTFLHVSTDLEWQESQLIFKDWVGKIIPNMVIMPEKIHNRSKNKIFTIGFLSRIEPKKGLDILIKALSKVQFPYKLLIAGTGSEVYTKALKTLSIRCGNDSNIEWIGWKSPETKFDFLVSLDLLALISHSENFAVVVIESLLVGTPVLITNNIGIHKFIEQKDIGWITTIVPEKITDCLNDLIKEEEKIKRINNCAPGETQTEFNGNSALEKYVSFYNYVHNYNKDLSFR